VQVTQPDALQIDEKSSLEDGKCHFWKSMACLAMVPSGFAKKESIGLNNWINWQI
jgi:hypothetical protein